VGKRASPSGTELPKERPELSPLCAGDLDIDRLATAKTSSFSMQLVSDQMSGSSKSDVLEAVQVSVAWRL
jgi:hypothetical protein